jgi:ferredoxin-NADP reductase
MIKLRLLNSNNPSDDNRHIEIFPEKMLTSECFIGRSSNCNIVLASPIVSNLHGDITYQQEQYFYRDLGSKTGTKINNQKVQVNQKYVLKPNDMISIGDYIVIVEKIVIGDFSAEIKPPPVPEPILPPEKPPTREAPPISAKDIMIPLEEITCWNKGNLTVNCAQIINETEDAKTFRFVAKPPVIFSYKPGQFVTLSLNINGKKVKRSYSISSTPTRPYCLEITVKRVPPPADNPEAPRGLVSNWLHDHLQVGDQIELNGPLGKFTCFANPAPKLLFISAGSGITPMMSMSRWAFDTVADLDIVFVHSARSPKDIIFREELELMAARRANFRLAITTTRSEPGQSWYGYRGRLDIPMLSSMAPDFWERQVYVCGPNPFMAGVKAMLQEAGFPMENYYEESFGGPKKPGKEPPPEAESQPPEKNIPVPPVEPSALPKIEPPAIPTPTPAGNGSVVKFSKSGKEVSCNGSLSILDLAEEEGVEIDSSCRSGACGTCKVKKLEGEVQYDGEPQALDDEEQEQGYILSCIAMPVGKVVIDA